MFTRRALVALLPSIPLALSNSRASAADPMRKYRWSKRPLLVFAPASTDGAMASQRAMINGSKAGVLDRDMVIVFVVGDHVETQFGERVGLGAAALRARFGVPADAFRVVLVGKDGGVKMTSGRPTPPSAIFRRIDSMPMRRQEMRRQQNSS